MRAVAVIVARGVELPGAQGIDAGIAAPGRVEVLGADELEVAVGGGEFLTGHALAVPTGDLLVIKLAGLLTVAVGAGAVGEAGVFGPDTGIDDADDDAVTGSTRAIELIPQAAFGVKAEEGGRGGGVDGLERIRRNRKHARQGHHLGSLGLGELGSEAVEGVGVIVHLLAAADAGEGGIMLALEVGDVGDHVRIEGIDLFRALGGRGFEAFDGAFVGHNGFIQHLDDVNAVGAGGVFGGDGGGESSRCSRRGHQDQNHKYSCC